MRRLEETFKYLTLGMMHDCLLYNSCTILLSSTLLLKKLVIIGLFM